MSMVYNCILSFFEPDHSLEKVEEVNRYFEERGYRGVGFVHIQDPSAFQAEWYGGRKVLETDIAIGAFNYLDVPALAAHIASLEWEYPEEVQLLVKGQDDDQFRTIPTDERAIRVEAISVLIEGKGNDEVYLHTSLPSPFHLQFPGAADVGTMTTSFEAPAGKGVEYALLNFPNVPVTSTNRKTGEVKKES